MSDTKGSRLHAIVEGRVQGVGFRAFVISRAEQMGLAGWVRNCWDGTVEIVAEGERETLEKLLSAIRKGPPASYVSGVKTDWGTASGEFNRFNARSTA
jgi:acylphosphatase